jgi:NTP pyrophosphatase (non-canonical NTP hydrolase)
MMTFEEIEKKVIWWADDRRLFDNTTSLDQYRKLKEEFDELGNAIVELDKLGIQDAIGDMIVVLTMIARILGTNLTSCYTVAYDEIKDRKGKMVNGIFVKE